MIGSLWSFPGPAVVVILPLLVCADAAFIRGHVGNYKCTRHPTSQQTSPSLCSGGVAGPSHQAARSISHKGFLVPRRA